MQVTTNEEEIMTVQIGLAVKGLQMVCLGKYIIITPFIVWNY